MKSIVTGCAGFIGSALVRTLLERGHEVTGYDKLTYSGLEENLSGLGTGGQFQLRVGDICDRRAFQQLLEELRPDVVFHLAAESHVDRSIDGPRDFLETNVIGTFEILESIRSVTEAGRSLRLVHVSTDEVFGSLGPEGYFTESSRYKPNSPYSATKAASDHLARAWHKTFNLDVVITNCSNNYGPRQFPEKLIPLTILNAIERKPVQVYGDGAQIRDWLHVEDHVRGLVLAAEQGTAGATYNFGGAAEQTNLQVVGAVFDALAAQHGHDRAGLESLITFVGDRPGHDRRYAIDAAFARESLGWLPKHDFKSGIGAAVSWYCDNMDWCRAARNRYAGERLGNGESAAL